MVSGHGDQDQPGQHGRRACAGEGPPHRLLHMPADGDPVVCVGEGAPLPVTLAHQLQAPRPAQAQLSSRGQGLQRAGGKLGNRRIGGAQVPVLIARGHEVFGGEAPVHQAVGHTGARGVDAPGQAQGVLLLGGEAGLHRGDGWWPDLARTLLPLPGLLRRGLALPLHADPLTLAVGVPGAQGRRGRGWGHARGAGPGARRHSGARPARRDALPVLADAVPLALHVLLAAASGLDWP